MKKLIIGGVVVILLVVGGYGVYTMYYKGEIKIPTDNITNQVSQEGVWNIYATTTIGGFSIKYPQGYKVDEAYAYDGVNPKKLISGVKFTVSEAMVTGTNLSNYDTGVSVEWLPRANNCTGDIYVLANVKAQKITEGGIDYSLATTTGGAAGNLYEEWVYALATSSPCTAIRYFIHSTSMGNYPEGAVREFNRAALISEFDKIRMSLVLGK